LEKECEAKLLKVTHLKYEKENLVRQTQKEEAMRKEMLKGAREQMKRI